MVGGFLMSVSVFVFVWVFVFVFVFVIWDCGGGTGGWVASSVFVFVIWGCVCRWHTGGWLPNVCVSHAANSSLTGLLSSHLDLHCITTIVFLLCTSWISLAAVLYFSEISPTHSNAWFIVCLSVTLSQFVENTNSVQKKETNIQFTSSLWKGPESMLMCTRNVAQIRSVNDGGRKWPKQRY